MRWALWQLDISKSSLTFKKFVTNAVYFDGWKRDKIKTWSISVFNISALFQKRENLKLHVNKQSSSPSLNWSFNP